MLDDHTRAPGEKLRAMLAFMHKSLHASDDLSAGDAAAVRAAGVSDQAIGDALNVMYLFDIYNRLADAFGWTVMSPEAEVVTAKILLRFGYE